MVYLYSCLYFLFIIISYGKFEVEGVNWLFRVFYKERSLIYIGVVIKKIVIFRNVY